MDFNLDTDPNPTCSDINFGLDSLDMAIKTYSFIAWLPVPLSSRELGVMLVISSLSFLFLKQRGPEPKWTEKSTCTNIFILLLIASKTIIKGAVRTKTGLNQD